MASVTRTQIVDALAALTDPVSGRNPVAAGRVSDIAIEDGRVRVTLEADSPEQAPALEPLQRQAEEALRGLAGVQDAVVILTAERKSGKAEGQAQPSQAGKGQGAAQVKHVIAVASGKGGVGKSTTAVNLALALSALGWKTGILDVDVYGPSLPKMLGVNDKPQSHDGRILEPIESKGLKAMSIGFMVAEEEPVIWRGPMVMSALQQMLNDVHWGALDALILDMPPGTGDAALTVAQRAHLAGVVIVSTPQDIALLDARKGIHMFRRLNVPILGIIENMNMFICPACGHQTTIFGCGGAQAEAEKQGCPFLGSIPLHMDIRTGGDTGQPVVTAQPDGPHAAAFRRIAEQVQRQLAS